MQQKLEKRPTRFSPRRRRMGGGLAFFFAAAFAAAASAAPPAPSLAPNKLRAAIALNRGAPPSLNPRRAAAAVPKGVGGPDTLADGSADALETGRPPRQRLIRLGARRAGPPATPEPFVGTRPRVPFADAPAVGSGYAAAPARMVARADGDVPQPPETTQVSLQSGETLVDALERAGVRREDRNDAAKALSGAINLRALRPGATFDIVLARPNATLFQSLFDDDAERRLIGLSYRPEATKLVRLLRTTEGFAAESSERPLDARLASVSGDISGSLFVSARRKGAPAGAIIKLANMFAYDIDFQRDIFGGDAYEAVFEALYDDDGDLVGAGDVVYGRLSWRGGRKSKGYYRFQSANGGARADFYDADGQSAKRLLMKTPIDGARLSSGFGTRRHPVLGYRKQHKGVDFAARRGTPIYAAGDGVVERANRYGSYGNYIRIRHAQGYKTAYAHLKGFRRGVRKGARVEQGDIIGYVGTTGRSTGPHLHYEVIKNGKHVNPQKLKIATGVQLKGQELSRFKAERDRIDAMRAAAAADDETDPAPPTSAAAGAPVASR